MNRRQRRIRAAVLSRDSKTAELTDIPLDQIGPGVICGWVGCTARFDGDMPQGWCWNISYWDKTTSILNWTTEDWAQRPYSDVALCPEHTRELRSHFKGSGIATLVKETDGRA